MTDKNLPQHDLTAQLYLKFLLITQYEELFINQLHKHERSDKKGRMTEQRTANVQMPILTKLSFQSPDVHIDLLVLAQKVDNGIVP